MMGLYPNAGQSCYLIHSPLLKETTIRLPEGKTFNIVAKNFSKKNAFIQSATLNGKPYPLSWIEHSDLVKGGVLELTMGEKASGWGSSVMPPSMQEKN